MFEIIQKEYFPQEWSNGVTGAGAVFRQSSSFTYSPTLTYGEYTWKKRGSSAGSLSLVSMRGWSDWKTPGEPLRRAAAPLNWCLLFDLCLLYREHLAGQMERKHIDFSCHWFKVHKSSAISASCMKWMLVLTGISHDRTRCRYTTWRSI